MCQNIKLYYDNFIHNFGGGCLYCSCFGRKRARTQLQRMYESGSDRLDEELDIVKIIRNLKNLRILMKSHIITKKKALMYQIIHDDKNVINLDQTYSSCEAADKEDDSFDYLGHSDDNQPNPSSF